MRSFRIPGWARLDAVQLVRTVEGVWVRALKGIPAVRAGSGAAVVFRAIHASRKDVRLFSLFCFMKVMLT